MLRNEDRERIRHMRDAAKEAIRFAAGRTRADLDGDRMLLFALVQAVQIVGEAAGKVTSEGRAACPSLPWPRITGIRHRLVHDYFSWDLDQVWTTVTSDLPRLVTELDRALGEARP